MHTYLGNWTNGRLCKIRIHDEQMAHIWIQWLGDDKLIGLYYLLLINKLKRKNILLLSVHLKKFIFINILQKISKTKKKKCKLKKEKEKIHTQNGRKKKLPRTNCN